MILPEAYLKALAALVCATFGAVLALSRPRRAPALHLSAFLLLIAANQACEAMRTLYLVDDPRHLFWWRGAKVFAALDPLFLALFAATYPEPARAPGRILWSVLGGAAFLALWAGWGPMPRPDAVEDALFSFVITVFTFAVYALVLRWSFRSLLREPHEVAWRFLLPAAAFVALPVWGTLVSNTASLILRHVLLIHDTPAVYTGCVVAILLGPLALLAILRPEARAIPLTRENRRLLLATAAGALVLLALLQLYTMHRALGLFDAGLPGGERLQSVGRSGAPLRWLLFGGLVSVALLRHDAMGLPLAARRRAARVLIGVVLFTSAALAFALASLAAGANTLDLPPLALAGMGLLLVLSQGFHSVVDRVALRAYGVPMPGDVVARQEAYRSACARAFARGVDPAQDAGMARLRDELGLDAPVARALERAAEALSDEPLAPGRLVAGRYRVARMLGRGGSGRVFLARDETLRREVVLKEVADDPHDAILREARLAGHVQHPNVVTVHDVIARPGAPVLVAEYVPNGTLEDLLAQRGPLPLHEALALFRGVLSGLAAIHGKGIVHRDLKPANVLLQPPMVPKIADFGIASARRHTVGLGEAPFAGTPGAMAPEQARGLDATPRTDVYAAGLLLRRLAPHPLPPELEALARRALQDDPAERWADAGEMLRALDAAHVQ